MSQHTPGPWTMTLPQGGILVRTENKGKPCTWIAEVFKNGASRLVGENAASEEGIANACLILAAPDLLEAVNFSLNLIDKMERGEISTGEFSFVQTLAHKKLRDARDRATAAIASEEEGNS